MQEKQEKKECLPETVQAILTVFASAGILIAFAAERYILAIIAVASMTVLKFCGKTVIFMTLSAPIIFLMVLSNSVTKKTYIPRKKLSDPKK